MAPKADARDLLLISNNNIINNFVGQSREQTEAQCGATVDEQLYVSHQSFPRERGRNAMPSQPTCTHEPMGLGGLPSWSSRLLSAHGVNSPRHHILARSDCVGACATLTHTTAWLAAPAQGGRDIAVW